MNCVSLLIIGDGYVTGNILLDIQYEHYGSYNRCACYARQTGKKDSETAYGISLDNTFSSDDNSLRIKQFLQPDVVVG